MCQFEVSNVSLYSFIIVFVLSLVVSFSILLNDRKNPVNRNIFFFLIIFTVWIGNTILTWYIRDVAINFILDELTTLLVIAILFLLYFSYSFSGMKISLRKKLLLTVPFIPIIALTFSDYNFTITDARNCTFEYGNLIWYVYLVGITYTAWSMVILIKKYRDKATSYKVKNQIRTLAIAFAFIVAWIIIFNIIGDWATSQNIDIEEQTTSFFMLGMMFFISLLSFAITRYSLFKFNMISTKALVTVLWMILLVMMFFLGGGIAYMAAAFMMYLFLIVVFWIGSISRSDPKKKKHEKMKLREKISDMKLIIIQVVTVGVWILIGSQFFFVKDRANRVLSGVTLAITIAFGIMLIGSIREEMKKKEELERMNKRLEKANVELKRLDQAKSEFLSISSHQLRTPITVIKGVASMLKEGDLENAPLEERKRFYDSILIKSEKLETIINDLLNATDLTTRKYNMMDKKVENVNLADLIKEILIDFEIEIKDRALTVTLLPGKKDSSEIEGQKEYLRESLINLISNAIKYTPSSGKTNDIRDERKEIGIIEIGIESDLKRKNNILIKVSDNGIGIPKEEISKLFKKFSRADNAKNMYTDGTGIGLFVVKEIVEGHGGHVWVKSELGKGSTFFVTLPIHHKKGVDIKRYILDKQEA